MADMDDTCPNCSNPKMGYDPLTRIWVCGTCGLMYFNAMPYGMRDEADRQRMEDRLAVSLLLDSMGVKHGR